MGCPSYLLSDCGTQFKDAQFKERCRNLGIRKIYASPYHPQGNGWSNPFTSSWVKRYQPIVAKHRGRRRKLLPRCWWHTVRHHIGNRRSTIYVTDWDGYGDTSLPRLDTREGTELNKDTHRRLTYLTQLRKLCLDRTYKWGWRVKTKTRYQPVK